MDPKSIQAFPSIKESKFYPTHEGMSLRDYFAAKWLQGWMANPSTHDANREDAAKWAYEMADAMLEAR